MVPFNISIPMVAIVSSNAPLLAVQRAQPSLRQGNSDALRIRKKTPFHPRCDSSGSESLALRKSYMTFVLSQKSAADFYRILVNNVRAYKMETSPATARGLFFWVTWKVFASYFDAIFPIVKVWCCCTANPPPPVHPSKPLHTQHGRSATPLHTGFSLIEQRPRLQVVQC